MVIPKAKYSNPTKNVYETCSITSKSINSALYGAITGGLIFIIYLLKRIVYKHLILINYEKKHGNGR